MVKKYTSQNINFVRRLIEQDGKDYEVYLDDVRIISRTNDLSKLDLISDYLSSESSEIKIKMFRGDSQHSDVIFLKIQNDLKGLETSAPTQENKSIDEKELREKLREELRAELLREQRVKSTEERLKERIEELEHELEQERSIKSYVTPVISGLGSLLGNNPALVQKFPILGALGNIPQTQEQEQKQEETEPTETRYKPKNMVKVPDGQKVHFETYLEYCAENPQYLALIHAPGLIPDDKLNDFIQYIISYSNGTI